MTVEASVERNLSERLRARREEIEDAIVTKVLSLLDSTDLQDPLYTESLRSAVVVAVNYGLENLEGAQRHTPRTPSLLLSQARRAARKGVGLDAILRRYVVGSSLLGGFVIQEAEKAQYSGPSLQSLLRSQAALLDRTFVEVSDEHKKETKRRHSSVEERRVEKVKRLLAGELFETFEPAYDFNCSHVGVIASGDGTHEAVRAAAQLLDCRLLLVRPSEDATWAWLGTRRHLDSGAVVEAMAVSLSGEGFLTIGEPAEGETGWRLTHRQAIMTMPVALRGGECLLRYADVPLVASMSRDDLLIDSLHQLFVRPLEGGRPGKAVALKTLKAYFSKSRNISSAAASLGTSRQTVSRRLSEIEDRLGRPLSKCTLELEAILALHEYRIGP